MDSSTIEKIINEIEQHAPKLDGQHVGRVTAVGDGVVAIDGLSKAVMSEVVVFILRAYQAIISPLLPPNTCRFYPTCSQYSIDAMRKYGVVRGTYRSLKRLSHCHPYHPGGYDPA